MTDEAQIEFSPDLATSILDHVQKESKDDIDVAVFHMMACIVALVRDRTQAQLLLNLTYDFADRFREAHEAYHQEVDGETFH